MTLTIPGADNVSQSDYHSDGSVTNTIQKMVTKEHMVIQSMIK